MNELDRQLRERLPGVRSVEPLQQLWRGWGRIVRVRLQDGRSVVVKQVAPRGAPGVSADRKRRSYQVEAAFYQRFAGRPGLPRLPRALRVEPGFFVLEDLDGSGFDERAVGAGSLSDRRIRQVLHWLARFHGTFLGDPGEGLWERGTYWHLATRPEEHRAMAPGPLQRAARVVDARLGAARFPTLVHGDAKVANVCFGPDGVALVDFQYTGRGPGVADVAYFLGSCLDDPVLGEAGDAWLEVYLAELRRLVPAGLAAPVEAEARDLWPFAWADFERCLAGWAPAHWKRTGYAGQKTLEALEGLT